MIRLGSASGAALSLALGVLMLGTPALGQEPEAAPAAPGAPPSAPVADAPAAAPVADPPAEVAAGPAASVEGSPPPPATAAAKNGEEEDGLADPEEDRAPSQKAKLTPRGRLFTIAELSSQAQDRVDADGVPRTEDVTSLDFYLKSARIGIDYSGDPEWLTAQVELELGGDKVRLRDAYANAEQKYWRARVGQFKVPFSLMELESAWTLPVARRGLVHDILVDHLDVAGRAPGLAGSVFRKGKLKTRLTLGAFQGSGLTNQTVDDRDTEYLEKVGLDAQSFVARGEIKWKGVQLGVAYEHRVGASSFAESRRFWTATSDVEWSWKNALGKLRVWADVIAGASWYEHAAKPDDGEDPTFLTTRLLVAQRFGGKDGGLYVEPFFFGALYDPDADVASDLLFEGMLGVSAGLWKRARLTLQGEAVDAQSNFPTSYAIGSHPNRLSLLLYAGVNF